MRETSYTSEVTDKIKCVLAKAWYYICTLTKITKCIDLFLHPHRDVVDDTLIRPASHHLHPFI